MDDVELPDPGPAIHDAAAAHLEAVWAAFYAWEEDPGAVEVASPAVGPFCGCETCMIRETIAGAWPVIEAYFAAMHAAPAAAARAAQPHDRER
jgi:hypothetical protein